MRKSAESRFTGAILVAAGIVAFMAGIASLCGSAATERVARGFDRAIPLEARTAPAESGLGAHGRRVVLSFAFFGVGTVLLGLGGGAMGLPVRKPEA